jgi:chemotaxis protein methyltransferase CheR
MKPMQETGAAPPELAALDALLREKTGLILKREMLVRLSGRLDRFMGGRGLTDRAACLRRLRHDPEALQEVVDFLTVNETYFFREPAQIDLFVRRLLPEILDRKPPGEPVRILSAGCATGEEPYSLAMALADAWGIAFLRERVRLTGVDIDRAAIRTARNGTYGPSAFRRLDPDLRRRYFTPSGDGRHTLRPGIREQVRFRHYNLLETPFPDDLTAMDAIFYRNVSIYFEPAVRKRIFTTLSAALAPEGYLFVSATETLSHDFRLLRLLERDGIYLYQKADPDTAGPPPAAPVLQPVRRPAPAPKPAARARKSAPRPETGPDHGPKSPQPTPAPSPDPATGPDDPRARTLEAARLLEQNLPAEAGRICESVLAQDPFRTDALLLLGIIARSRSDPAGALARFKSVIYHRTDNWLAHFYLALLHEEAGRPDAARREYAIVLRLLEQGRFPDHGLPRFPLAFTEADIRHLCREKVRHDLR